MIRDYSPILPRDHVGKTAAEYRTWQSWNAMRARCNRKSSTNYDLYGGAGIKCCASWSTFRAFVADMGLRPEGMTLDRYPDQSGNYEPSNCRWATAKQQALNSRRVIALIEFRGEVDSLLGWSRRFGLNNKTLKKRLAHGWSIEAALLTPTTFDPRTYRASGSQQ